MGEKGCLLFEERKKQANACYNKVEENKDRVATIDIYDISSKQSPILKCIRKNLLFPKQYYKGQSGKKKRAASKTRPEKPNSFVGSVKLSQSGDWRGYNDMRLVFSPKESSRDIIKKSISLIEKTIVGLQEIKAKKAEIKSHKTKKTAFPSNILEEMDKWI